MSERSSARLFVAIDLDDAARCTVARAAGELAEQIAATGAGDRVAWVRPKNLHLTLRFLGQVGAASVPEVSAAITQLTAPVFGLEVSGSGAFPKVGAPRVLWVGVTYRQAPLQALMEELDRRLVSAGLTVESRPFAGHVTVGRIKRASGGGRAIRQAIGRMRVESVQWRVDQVTLYESRLSPSGPTYLAVTRGRLSGADARSGGAIGSAERPPVSKM